MLRASAFRQKGRCSAEVKQRFDLRCTPTFNAKELREYILISVQVFGTRSFLIVSAHQHMRRATLHRPKVDVAHLPRHICVMQVLHHHTLPG